MKLRHTHAFVVVDSDGRVCWALAYRDKREASEIAKHPKRKVARVEVVSIARKRFGKRRRR